MRVCHCVSVVFDDPNVASRAGLAPVLTLAERAGLHRLVAEHVRISRPGGCNPELKVGSLIAGMIAGADLIDDMAPLRHGGMDRLFAGVRARSTLGTFLRRFTFGHVRQLDAVASRFLIGLARHVPLLPDACELAYVDVDDTVRRTYGYAKQGAGRGYTWTKGLNALIAIVSTPSSTPVIAAARLRKGSTNSVKGAHRLVADALVTAKAGGATGRRVLPHAAADHTLNDNQALDPGLVVVASTGFLPRLQVLEITRAEKVLVPMTWRRVVYWLARYWRRP